MLRFKKSLGQNFLIDKNIINKIISIDNLNNENILEIGPGSGNLTDFIIKEKVKNIVVIEKDESLCKLLGIKFNKIKNLKIIKQDILNYNLNNLNLRDVIVFGNLPYNISTQILVDFLNVKKWPPFFKKIIFMFQKEVADRILAKPNTKNYGRLAILVNYRLNVIDSFKISKNSFFPVPGVDSKIVVFKPKLKFKYKILNIENLENITNIFFRGKRKMINKPMSKIFKNYELIAQQLKISLSARPSELSFEDYFRLVEYYEKFNKLS